MVAETRCTDDCLWIWVQEGEITKGNEDTLGIMCMITILIMVMVHKCIQMLIELYTYILNMHFMLIMLSDIKLLKLLKKDNLKCYGSLAMQGINPSSSS